MRPLRPPREIRAEQRAHLVAGQRPPAPLGERVGNRDGQPVAIRVVGEHQVRPEPAGLRPAPGRALPAPLGWERRRSGSQGRGPPAPRPRPARGSPRCSIRAHRQAGRPRHAAACRRCAARRWPGPAGSGTLSRDRVQVGLGHLVTELGDQRTVGPAGRDLGQRAERRGWRASISRVGGRHDLRAVAEIELVAVVRARVVAGRDHDAGRSADKWRTANASSGVGAAAAAGGPGCPPRRARARPRRRTPPLGAGRRSR